MAGRLQPLDQQDFSKGMNAVTSPYNLVQGQVRLAFNLQMDEHGALRTRDGTLIQGAKSPFPTRPIVKIYDFVQVNMTILPLAVLLGAGVQPNTLYRRDTNPWTVIGNFKGVFTIPDILTFSGGAGGANDVAILANGPSEPLSAWDGGPLIVPLSGNPPNAAHIASHLGFLWAWNTNTQSQLSSGPSSLQSSDLNNPGSWPGANQTFLAKDDGTQGQGLGLFTIAEAGISPTATLIAWKDFSGFQCTSPFGVNFVVQKIKSDMGCVAPRSIQFISGFGLIRLSHRGVSLYDGVSDTLISEEIRPYIFGRDAINGLDWSNIAKSMAAQVANPPVYLVACPVAGGNGTLQRVFLYDLVRRSWSIAQYTNDLSTVQLILDPNKLPSVLIGDASLGFVRRAFAGDATDDGADITAITLLRAFFIGSPVQRAYWRRMLASFFGMAAGTSITATFSRTPTDPLGQVSSTKVIPTVSPFMNFPGYGLGPYGTGAYGDQAGPTITDAILEFPMGFLADNVQPQLSWTGPGRLRMMELHARQKSLTRSTVVNA